MIEGEIAGRVSAAGDNEKWSASPWAGWKEPFPCKWAPSSFVLLSPPSVNSQLYVHKRFQ